MRAQKFSKIAVGGGLVLPVGKVAAGLVRDDEDAKTPKVYALG